MKGDEDDPLTLADLPFDVPVTGRYWIVYEGTLIELPEAPAGGVLELQSTTMRMSDGSLADAQLSCRQPK